MGNTSWKDLVIAGSFLGAIALASMLLPDGTVRDMRNRWYAERFRTRCTHNMQRIATACEMYSTDNAGRFPTVFARLVPSYLPTPPTCPTTDTDTYSAGFQSASQPDAYTMVCKGGRHRNQGVPEELDYRPVIGMMR